MGSALSAPGALAPSKPAGPSSAYGGTRMSSSAGGWSRFNDKKSTSAGGTASIATAASGGGVVPPLQLSRLDDWMDLQSGGEQEGEDKQQGGTGAVGFWAEVPVSSSREFRSSRTSVSAGGKLSSQRGSGSSSGGGTSRAVSAKRATHSHH